MRTLSKFLLGTAISMAVSTGAYAQGLFSDMLLEEQSMANMVQIDGEVKSRQVKLDKSMAARLFDKQASADSISLSLFAGRNITLKRTEFDGNLGEGTRNWSGRVEGFEDGSATLVYLDDDRIIGQIRYGGNVFRISPSQNGVHVISELNLDHLPDEGPLMEAPDDEPNFKRTNMDRAPAAWSPRIRLLVFYTPGAITEANAAGVNPRDEAVLGMALANTAYINTGMNGQRLKFAGFRSTYCSYDENGLAYAQPLLDITNAATCIGARAASVRNSNSADMVALIRRNGGGSCGVAWYITSHPRQERMFSLTSRDCISNQTLAHELGHNMGLNHDRVTAGNVGNNQTLYNYGIGLPFASTPVRTIMSYSRPCSNVGVNCTRVDAFSNMRPGNDWEGVRIGRGLWQSDPAIARKTMLNNWDTITTYR